MVGVAAVDIPLCEIEAAAVASGVSPSYCPVSLVWMCTEQLEGRSDLYRGNRGTLRFVPGKWRDVKICTGEIEGRYLCGELLAFRVVGVAAVDIPL